MNKSIILASTFAIALLTGCASTSSITPEYVSTNTYTTYDCTSLDKEYKRIGSYITQTKKNSFSLASTGVSIGMYGDRDGIFPSISFGVGQSTDIDDKNKKLSRLYGERDALVQTARLKRCPFANGLKLYSESIAKK